MCRLLRLSPATVSRLLKSRRSCLSLFDEVKNLTRINQGRTRVRLSVILDSTACVFSGASFVTAHLVYTCGVYRFRNVNKRSVKKWFTAIMSPTTILGGEHRVLGLSVRPSVHFWLTPISRDVISLYLVEGFQ